MSGSDWMELRRKGTLRVAGLMSGTSADGIDVAIVDIATRGAKGRAGAARTPRRGGGLDGAGSIADRGVKLLAFRTYPYPPAVRREVLALCGAQEVPPAEPLAARENLRALPSAAQPGAAGHPALAAAVQRVCHMNFALGELFADAVLRLAGESGIDPGGIDLIGSHGQTICHLPEGRRFLTNSGRRLVRSTLQIAEASVIAERTGITTVADFRPRDIAAGGLGAPLVPFADHYLFAHARLSRVLCNIGGIANITHLPAGAALGDVLAFDTGPGNMVIDELVRRFTAGRRQFDRGGRIAAGGCVHGELLGELLGHPYFRRRPPKTTGRELFGAAFAEEMLRRGGELNLAEPDLAATAAALTAQSIARACRKLPGRVDELILCGGGSRNPVLVDMLRTAMAPAAVKIMDELGLDADAKEAVSFAILAAETIRGRASNVPTATGADRPVVLGKIVPGR